jgi:hypothetical protein
MNFSQRIRTDKAFRKYIIPSESINVIIRLDGGNEISVFRS